MSRSDSPDIAFTRRRMFKGAAVAAAALMPPNVRRALAQQQNTQGSLRDIKHIVVLMQENRSFDHYFGTLSLNPTSGDGSEFTLNT